MSRGRAKERQKASDARTSRWRAYLPEALLVLTCCVLYANTLGNGFVGDDRPEVLRNPWIRDWHWLREIFALGDWRLRDDARMSMYYRPLRNVVYLLEYRLFGLTAWGFHLVNLLFHAANTVLVLRVARRLTAGAGSSTPGSDTGTGLSSPAFLAALLFAVHPVHTESVAWVAALPELSYTFLLLVALLAHARVESPLDRWHALAAVSFFGALLCKEPAIVLLVLLPAWDRALGRQRRTWSELAVVYAPYGLGVALYLAMRLYATSGAMPLHGDAHGLDAFQLLLNVPPLFAKYLATLALPLNPDLWHPYEPVREWRDWRVAASVLVAAGFAGAMVRTYERDRRLFFALLVVLLPLLPALHIRGLSGKLFAERYLYLPSVGFVVVAAALLGGLARKRPSLLWPVLVPVLAICGVATVARNAVWHDTTTLLEYVLSRSPGAADARFELAGTLVELGRIDEAIEQYERLVRSDPNDARYRSALGSALIRKGDLAQAVTQLETALRLDPALLASYNDLAIALRASGRTQEAIATCRKALAIDPNYAEAHYSLGNMLADSGAIDEATEHFRLAARAQPDNAFYRGILGIEYGKQGRLAEAIEQFEAAVRLDPAEPAYRRNLERARGMQAAGRR